MCITAASVGTSLWGDKLLFNGPPCLWQLQPNVLVPALSELSVCTLLRLTLGTEWTGFVYKAPQKQHIELGLGGTPTELTTWLFGKEYPVPMELKLNEWYTICITWSDQDQEMGVYVNGLVVLETHLAPEEGLHHQLAQNGTLTLGVSHFISVNGELRPESGNKLLGEIGLFKMWGRKWSAEELIRQNCAEGDVVGWDLQQWKHNCLPEPDSSLHCGKNMANYCRSFGVHL